jgi:hypothetical protein
MEKLKEENGVVLVVTMLLLLVFTLIGMSAVNTATYDNLISGNKRISEQAFYLAEAGINEFLGRFREGATGELKDNAPSNPHWKLFIASNAELAEKIGYSSSDADHVFVQSLQNPLAYGVEIRHKADIANKVITKAGAPLYIATSYGYTQDGGKKVIEADFIGSPPFDPPAALYTERPIDVHGTSTVIQGMDQCGATNKPGILTTLLESTNPINISGNPTIQGNPDKKYNGDNLGLRAVVNYLKEDADANSTYDYNSNQTLTGYSDSWGTPTSTGTSTPITYDGPMKIVYFNMHGDKTLKLAGQSHGAGLLLVDGNLDLNGGFTWYGVIIVTGALDFTGGGEKNVTGGILTGEAATVQVDLGGNAGILYCSQVADKLKKIVTPLRMTRWKN